MGSGASALYSSCNQTSTLHAAIILESSLCSTGSQAGSNSLKSFSRELMLKAITVKLTTKRTAREVISHVPKTIGYPDRPEALCYV